MRTPAQIARGAAAEERYEQGMQDLLGRVQRADDRAARDRDDEALRAALATIERTVGQLRALEPQAAVRAAHGDYVAGFEAFARVRSRALRDVLRGDRRLLPAESRVSRAARERVLAARRAFAEREIDITPSP